MYLHRYLLLLLVSVLARPGHAQTEFDLFKRRADDCFKQSDLQCARQNYERALRIRDDAYCRSQFHKASVTVTVKGKLPPVSPGAAPKYDSKGEFTEGMARVTKGGKYGFINKQNLEVIPCTFAAAWDFQNGLARVQQNGLFGFVDKIGEFVVKPTYQTAYDFSDETAVVELNKKWGVIDDKGRLLVPTEYDDITKITNAVFRVQTGEKKAVLTRGKRLFSGVFGGFSDGMAWAVNDEGRYGALNEAGEVMVPFDYSYGWRFSASRTLVRKWGETFFYFIDKQGNRVEPDRKYDYFLSGQTVMPVRRGTTWGYLNNETWAEVLPCQYEFATSFSNGKALIRKDGQTFFVNDKGAKLADAPVNYTDCDADLKDDQRRVRLGNRVGYINANWQEVTPLQEEAGGSPSPAPGPTAAAPAGAKAEETYTIVDEQPQFTGGASALNSWLKSNISYPEKAQQANVQGKVIVSFVVGTDGQLADIKVMKGPGLGLNEEAIRLIKTMPRWQPGKLGGRSVRAVCTLPINFQLQ